MARHGSFLPIAPSTYYEHLAKRADPARLPDRARRDAALRPEVLRVFEENWRVYGVRKIRRQLQREGLRVAVFLLCFRKISTQFPGKRPGKAGKQHSSGRKTADAARSAGGKASLLNGLPSALERRYRPGGLRFAPHITQKAADLLKEQI